MWISIEQQLPPEKMKVLGYTDENNYKVVTYYNGKFDTYTKILFWTNLPSPPNTTEIEAPKKKRGRPKKNT